MYLRSFDASLGVILSLITFWVSIKLNVNLILGAISHILLFYFIFKYRARGQYQQILIGFFIYYVIAFATSVGGLENFDSVVYYSLLVTLSFTFSIIITAIFKSCKETQWVIVLCSLFYFLFESLPGLSGGLANPIKFGFYLVDSPLAPLFSIVGASGLSAIFIYICCTLGAASKYPIILTALLVTGLSFVLKPSDPENPRTISVSVVQPNLKNEVMYAAYVDPIVNSYAKSIVNELIIQSPNSNLVVLPELSSFETIRGTQDSLSTNHKGEFAVLGARYSNANSLYNSAFIARNDRSIISRHDKIHTVPHYENHFSKGSATNLVTLDKYIKLGIVICWESITEDQILKLANLGSNLIVVLTDDSFSRSKTLSWMHTFISRVRALENGVTIIHASQAGPSAAFTSYGRVVAESDYAERTTLQFNINPENRKTFYRKHRIEMIIISVVAFSILFLLTVGQKNLEAVKNVRQKGA